MPCGLRPLARDHPAKRPPKNAKIQPQRHMIYVPHIVIKLLLPSDRVAPVNLRPAGDSGADVVATLLMGAVAGKVAHQERPRSNQAHVPRKHVVERWKLVEASLSQQRAHSGEPSRVVQQCALFIAGLFHRPKLDEIKRVTVESRALLNEEHRSPLRQPQDEPDHQDHRCRHDRNRHCQRKVEPAFSRSAIQAHCQAPRVCTTAKTCSPHHRH